MIILNVSAAVVIFSSRTATNESDHKFYLPKLGWFFSLTLGMSFQFGRWWYCVNSRSGPGRYACGVAEREFHMDYVLCLHLMFLLCRRMAGSRRIYRMLHWPRSTGRPREGTRSILTGVMGDEYQVYIPLATISGALTSTWVLRREYSPHYHFGDISCCTGRIAAVRAVSCEV